MSVNLSNVTYAPTVSPINASQMGNPENTASTATTIRVPANLTPNEAGAALLSHLNAGDQFTGEITNITQNQITIALSESVSITAALSNALSYNIGDMASFTIQENTGSQIILKTVPPEQQNNLMNDTTIQNALKNAGLSLNETTVSLVHEMMKQGLPIHAESLNHYAKLLGSVPSASPEDVIFLSKMNLPVTEENVSALQDYCRYNNGMEQKAENITGSLIDLLKQSAGDCKECAAVLHDFIDSFSQTVSKEETIGTAFSESALKELADLVKDLAAKNPAEAGQRTSQIPEQLLKLEQKISDGNITAKEILRELSELMKQEPFHQESVKSFLDSEQFGKLVNSFIRQEFFLNPEDVTKQNLKKLFAKIIEDGNELAEKFEHNPKAEQLLQQTSEAKQNVNFMNQINHFMNFVQIPVKLSGQNTHGDLYVYKNNRKKQDSDGELTALLHLDMDYLGAMDIFVKLKEQNVTTNFKVQSDEILDYIEAHLEQLNERLRALGYHVNSKVETSSGQESSYNFKESVLEEEFPPVEIKRFSFDVRA